MAVIGIIAFSSGVKYPASLSLSVLLTQLLPCRCFQAPLGAELPRQVDQGEKSLPKIASLDCSGDGQCTPEGKQGLLATREPAAGDAPSQAQFNK